MAKMMPNTNVPASQARPSVSALCLRTLCIALAIQIIAGLVEDTGSAYAPFWTILLFYLCVPPGVPLAAMLALTRRHCKRTGEAVFRIGSQRPLRTAAYAFPASWLLRVCFGGAVTGSSNKQILFQRNLGQLPLYPLAGAALYLLSVLLKKAVCI